MQHSIDINLQYSSGKAQDEFAPPEFSGEVRRLRRRQADSYLPPPVEEATPPADDPLCIGDADVMLIIDESGECSVPSTLSTELMMPIVAGSVASDEDFENQRLLAIDVVKSIKSFGSDSNFGIVTFSNEAVVRVPFRPGHSRAQAIQTIEGWRASHVTIG